MNGKIRGLMIGSNPRLLNLSLLLLRCAAGIILFGVGASKVMGWFGGQGIAVTVQNFSKMGFPALLTYMSSYTEFIGGFLFIIGLFTRPTAIAVTINMFMATKTMWPHGFLFNGAAYPFMVLVSAIIIFLVGPMHYSIDSILFKTGNLLQ